MTSSFVYENPQSVPKLPTLGFTNAVAYGKVNRRWVASWGSPPFRNEKVLTTGDGSIWSNLEDLALWDEAVRERQFLKPETWRAALTPSKTRDGKTNNYGYGWSLYFDEANQLIGFGHDGSWGGFRSSYYFRVPSNRTTILLGNRANFDMDKFWYALQAVIERRLAAKG
jgi:CubicO group peptidase (beta-lactamase class C family)